MRPSCPIGPVKGIVNVVSVCIIGIQSELGPYRSNFREVNYKFSSGPVDVISIPGICDSKNVLSVTLVAIGVQNSSLLPLM